MTALFIAVLCCAVVVAVIEELTIGKTGWHQDIKLACLRSLVSLPMLVTGFDSRA
jgi:hypothetical protein